MASSRAKQLIITDSELDPNTEVIDVPTCFDGSWSSRGWVAKSGIAAAIAQNTSQVVDVIFKSSSCRQCTKIEERRKAGECDTLEYFEWRISHEPQCFYNHDGSSQVKYM